MSKVTEKLKRSKLWAAVAPSIACLAWTFATRMPPPPELIIGAIGALVTYIVAEGWVDAKGAALDSREIGAIWKEISDNFGRLRNLENKVNRLSLAVMPLLLIAFTGASCATLSPQAHGSGSCHDHAVIPLAAPLNRDTIRAELGRGVPPAHLLKTSPAGDFGLMVVVPATLVDVDPYATPELTCEEKLSHCEEDLADCASMDECDDELAECQTQLAACQEAKSFRVDGLLSGMKWFQNLPAWAQYAIRGAIYVGAATAIIMVTANGGG